MRFLSVFVILTSVPISTLLAYDHIKMLCLVNQQRADNGRRPLAIHRALENSSQEHSDDQAYMGSMTHDGSDGSSPSDRITNAGYNWSGMAENVAYGYDGEEECMKQWMNSPGHRENILGDYTHFGSAVGYSGSTPYYTQDFAKGESVSGNVPQCPSGSSNDYSGGGNADYSGNDTNDYSGGGNADYSGGNDDYSGGDTNDYSGQMPSRHSRQPATSYGKTHRKPTTYKQPAATYRQKPTTYKQKPAKATAYGGKAVKSSHRSPMRSPRRAGRKAASKKADDCEDNKPSYGGRASHHGSRY